ncbi:MAG TPA: response regulator [candidate division Zixibacteria bacterium]|nr:response regulator [candidate division Zixibacteria bacterium]
MMGEPLQILLVEDNQDHAELILRGLVNHRVANKVHHVVDGEAALDYLNRRGQYGDETMYPMPHLILLDLRLPKIDGLQVLRELKEQENLRRVPVVVLSTSKAEQDVAKAYDYHANSYLVKPVNFIDFTKLMDDLGFYWLAWNIKPNL